MAKAFRQLKVDQKNRITLSGLIPEGVSSVRATVDNKNRIILEPYIEIPAHEAWLFQNPEALEMVRKGLEQSGKSQKVDLGSFSSFSDDDE